MIGNKSKEYNIKNYFEYNKKKNISILRIISLIIFFIIIFNISIGILEIKNIENYILENNNSNSVLLDSKEELEKIKSENTSNTINMGNVRKIFETVGEENIDTLDIDNNNIRIVGRAKDIKTIEILLRNKLLKGSYVKKIEGGSLYTFEICSGERF